MSTAAQEKSREQPPAVRLERLVVVPKGVFNDYHGRSWTDLVADAEEGRDGLEVATVEICELGYPNVPKRRDDMAFMREGKGDRSLLFVQCW